MKSSQTSVPSVPAISNHLRIVVSKPQSKWPSTPPDISQSGPYLSGFQFNFYGFGGRVDSAGDPVDSSYGLHLNPQDANGNFRAQWITDRDLGEMTNAHGTSSCIEGGAQRAEQL